MEIIEYKKSVAVTDDDIDDIMVCALEGGINYWCKRVDVVGEYLGEYASEQISRGGSLVLIPFEEDEPKSIDKNAVLNGVKMYLESNKKPYDIIYPKNDIDGIDSCHIDALVSDMIIQYAAFGEQVYC